MTEKKSKKTPSFSEIKNEEAPMEIAEEADDEGKKSEPEQTVDDLPETKAITRVTEFSRPLVTASEASKSFQQYQELIKTLINESDVVEIQGRKKAKKTGINKIARFFGVSTEIIRTKREDSIGPQGGKNFTWYVWAKAWLPNGQSRVDGAACASNERRFAHLENDVLTTAITRATKRAIENLVGMGELELMEEDEIDTAPVLSKAIIFIRTALEKAKEKPDAIPLDRLSESEALLIVNDIKKAGKEGLLKHIKK